MKDYSYITMSLAGVCLAAKLANDLANFGGADKTDFRLLLETIVPKEHDSMMSIYGYNPEKLRNGLQELCQQLSCTDKEVGRYFLRLIVLEGKLRKDNDAKKSIADRLAYLPAQLSHYDITSEQICASLANIYSDFISPLGGKIQIVGSVDYLSTPYIQDRIRACLLAGIRSAVLWRQMGGSKWQFLFARRKILDTALDILNCID